MSAGRPELTPPFDCFTRPVRVGLYQRETISGWTWAVWDGQHWRCGSPDKATALNTQLFSGADLRWRGRAAP